jgi:hypothetical protein
MINKNILPFKLEISDEKLTPYAGLVLAHEFHLGLKLNKLLNENLPGPRSGRGYLPSDFVLPLILSILGGGRDLDDIKVIKKDWALREAAGLGNVPAPCTIGDWLRRTGKSKRSMESLSRVQKEMTRVMLEEGSRTDFTLDADATIIRAEKADATKAYEGTVGYQPMLGFLFENRWLIHDQFRTGSASPNSGIVDFIKECLSRMPEGTRIANFRSDSAAYNHEVTDFCQEKGIFYAIGADWDEAVKRAYFAIPEDSWMQFITPNSRREREVAETVHTFNKGKTSFRLIFIRDVEEQKTLFDSDVRGRAIISNFPQEEKDAVAVVNWYNERGTAENFIRELKHGAGMLHVPCGQFDANAAYFRIGALAYNLFLMQQAFAFPVELRNSTIATIRWRIYQSAARLVRHARKLVLKVVADANVFSIMERLRAASSRLAFT